MRSVLFCLCALFALTLYSSARPRPWQLTSQAAQQVQRDPQAIGILNQVVAAAGGATAIAAIQDFAATGQITYYWGDAPVRGTVSVKGRGLSEFRLDATLPDGVHSAVIGAGSTFQRLPDGSTSPLPSQNTVKAACLTLPILQIPGALQDSSLSVTYIGLIEQDGQKVHQLRVQKIFSSGTDPLGARSEISRTDFFVDPNSFYIVSTKDRAYRRDNGPGSADHVMRFSNYQAVSGLLVPLSITELIGSQQTLSIQLNQVSFNTGLTDSSFE